MAKPQGAPSFRADIFEIVSTDLTRIWIPLREKSNGEPLNGTNGISIVERRSKMRSTFTEAAWIKGLRGINFKSSYVAEIVTAKVYIITLFRRRNRTF